MSRLVEVTSDTVVSQLPLLVTVDKEDSTTTFDDSTRDLLERPWIDIVRSR